ncbi:MAG: hypothetical protein K0S71_45 [Clostridia bacterium]|jgi:energy-coupling factor transporter ATP-binding protein EcfA2|nr:hypothetical protein [Clostridia bacterium]
MNTSGESIKQYLNHVEIRATLPNYQNIFKEIKSIRDISKGFKEYTHSKYNHFPYKNVISILGERGSGKSTVFNTVRGILTREYDIDSFFETPEKDAIFESSKKLLESNIRECDINLDVIVPEMLENTSDILGVILLQIKDYLTENKESIDNFYEKDRRGRNKPDHLENCMYTNKNKLEICWDHVFTTYVKRTEGFDNIIQKNFSSLNEYTKEKASNLESEVKLSRDIYELFSELIKTKGVEKQPLIHLYFDDVDINPNRCSEVLKTLLRYLKHPHVVVFVSGDIKKFEEAMTMQEVIEEKFSHINEKVDGKRSVIDTKKELVYDLLKKIMPYSNRFHLLKLSNEDKKNFQYVYANGKKQKFEEVINTRLLGGQDRHSLIVNSTYSIFDEKPRGLITVWEYIENNFEEIDKEVKEKDEDFYKNQKEKVTAYRNLLEVIIDLNVKFKSEKQFIIEELISIDYMGHEQDTISIKINYDRFKIKIFNTILDTEKKHLYVMILQLAYFMEIIIKQKAIYENKYAELLNYIINKDTNKRLYPYTGYVIKLFCLYSVTSEILDINAQGQVFDVPEYFNIYINKICFDDYKEDPFWKEKFLDKRKFMDNSDFKIKEKLIGVFNGLEYNNKLLDSDIYPIEEKLSNIECKREKHIAYDRAKEILNKKKIQIENHRLAQIILENYKQDEVVMEEGKEIEESISLAEIKSERRKMLIKNLANTLDRALIESNVSVDKYKTYIGFNIDEEEKDIHERNFLEVINAYLNERIKKGLKYYRDDKTATNIKNLISKGTLKIHWPNEIIDCRESIIEYIEQELKQMGNNYNYQDKLKELVKCMLDNQKIVDTQKTVDTVESRSCIMEHSPLLDNEKNSGDFYLNIENPKGSWMNRRQNYIVSTSNLLGLCLEKLTIEGLLTDYFYINADTIRKILVDSTSNNRKVITRSIIHLERTYQKITQDIIADYDNNENSSYVLYELLAELKNNIKSICDIYKIEQINIGKLKELETLIDDETLRKETQGIREQIIYLSKISKVEMDDFIRRLDEYLSILKKQVGDSFKLVQLTAIAKELIINYPTLLSEQVSLDKDRRLIKEKIYEAELEFLMRSMKTIFMYCEKL